MTPATTPLYVAVGRGTPALPQWTDWVLVVAPIATAVVAVVAVYIALSQFRLARKLREEQARPYVVASLEMNGPTAGELVVQNLGKTVAKHVRIEFDPPARTALGLADGHSGMELDALPVPDFPVLVPGQRWVSLWDTTNKRRDTDLPSRYEVTVRSQDSKGNELDPLVYVLDWDVELRYRAALVRHGMHDAVGALRDIAKQSTKTGLEVQRIATVQRNRSPPWWERLRMHFGH